MVHHKSEGTGYGTLEAKAGTILYSVVWSLWKWKMQSKLRIWSYTNLLGQGYSQGWVLPMPTWSPLDVWWEKWGVLRETPLWKTIPRWLPASHPAAYITLCGCCEGMQTWVASVRLVCLIRKASPTSRLKAVLKRVHLGHETSVKLITDSSTNSLCWSTVHF